MPKLKTNRGAARRLRKTASGFKHRKANRNHILTKKAAKRKRQLAGTHATHASDLGRIAAMLPYSGSL
jgi:large subunit ribosomal protein L35